MVFSEDFERIEAGAVTYVSVKDEKEIVPFGTALTYLRVN